MQEVKVLEEKTKYKYKFSIVMAVYNVEPFLQEAIDSVLQQTIGFKENVQLILVDDGSKDQSGVICDAYEKAYPDNIMAIHKENGGVSSARNEGLKYVKGKYINFLDSDDKFSENVLSSVYAFFEQHEKKTDIVTIPLYFFDGSNGAHWQNNKFKKGKRVIDLWHEYDATLMFVNASFFHSRVKNLIVFDSRLVCGEDMKVLFTVLFERMRLGVVDDCIYWYRRRTTGEESLIQSSQKKYGWYFDYFTYLVDWAETETMKKFGFNPLHTQYTIAADLQWRVRQQYDMAEVLTEEEIKEYQKRLFSSLKWIDDKVILQQKMMWIEHKYYMLKKKYAIEPHYNVYEDDAELLLKNVVIGWLSGNYTKIEFIELKSDKLIIEGFTKFLAVSEEENIDIYFENEKNNGEILGKYQCILDKDSKYNEYRFDELIFRGIGFKCIIPLSNDVNNYSLKLCCDYMNMHIQKKSFQFGEFTPISTNYKNAYYRNQGWVLQFQNNKFKIFRYTILEAIRLEVDFSLELCSTRKKNAYKAAIARAVTICLKPLIHKEIWLLSDRINKADDNGEALFDYVNGLNKVKAYFVLGRESQDIGRLKKVGKVLIQNSWKHKMIHLLSDKIISSQADHFTTNPFVGYSEPYRDILAEQKFVFLQHGITKDNVSSWLNRRNKNIKLFITAAKPEYQSILDYDYDYDDSVVKLTGFPRHDRLYHDEKKIITIIPTWRAALVTGLDANTGLRNVKSNFETSTYNKMYTNLLTDKRLILAAEKYEYQIQFLPHPNMVDGMKYMKISSEIKILDLEMPYRKVFAESDLLITDYSSVAFDFTYLRKPVIYFQQDKEEFFANHTYTKGYFDYERDGFGEVCYDVEILVDMIIEYMQNGCQLKDKYRERIDNFFAFNDRNNCQRVYEEILKL